MLVPLIESLNVLINAFSEAWIPNFIISCFLNLEGSALSIGWWRCGLSFHILMPEVCVVQINKSKLNLPVEVVSAKLSFALGMQLSITHGEGEGFWRHQVGSAISLQKLKGPCRGNENLVSNYYQKIQSQAGMPSNNGSPVTKDSISRRYTLSLLCSNSNQLHPKRVFLLTYIQWDSCCPVTVARIRDCGFWPVGE